MNWPFYKPEVHNPTEGIYYLTEPGVELQGQIVVNPNGMQNFLEGFPSVLDFSSYMDDPIGSNTDGEMLVKIAGQLCYMSFGPKRTWNQDLKRYIRNLKEQGHFSVTEHANYTFLFWGVSRALTHELVRHRHLSFSQVSTRYCGLETLRFVESEFAAGSEDTHHEFLDSIKREHAVYAARCETLAKHPRMLMSYPKGGRDLKKAVQQEARRRLPHDVEAPIMVTGNVRAWRHFIGLRATRFADPEIRRLAWRLWQCLQQVGPNLFDDYMDLSRESPHTYPEGTLTTSFREV